MTNTATTITTITPMLMTTSEPVPADAQSGMTADEAAALYRLMTWLSPSFPVGAFSYSSGIEWAVEAGDIKDAESLRRWLAVVIGEGGGFCDAVFFIHAYRSLADTGNDALRAVAELAAAFAPSKERHLALRRARPVGRGMGWAGGLPGGGRRDGGRARHRP